MFQSVRRPGPVGHKLSCVLKLAIFFIWKKLKNRFTIYIYDKTLNSGIAKAKSRIQVILPFKSRFFVPLAKKYPRKNVISSDEKFRWNGVSERQGSLYQKTFSRVWILQSSPNSWKLDLLPNYSNFFLYKYHSIIQTFCSFSNTMRKIPSSLVLTDFLLRITTVELRSE